MIISLNPSGPATASFIISVSLYISLTLVPSPKEREAGLSFKNYLL
jgi:hypothetical protein